MDGNAANRRLIHQSRKMMPEVPIGILQTGCTVRYTCFRANVKEWYNRVVDTDLLCTGQSRQNKKKGGD